MRPPPNPQGLGFPRRADRTSREDRALPPAGSGRIVRGLFRGGVPARVGRFPSHLVWGDLQPCPPQLEQIVGGPPGRILSSWWVSIVSAGGRITVPADEEEEKRERIQALLPSASSPLDQSRGGPGIHFFSAPCRRIGFAIGTGLKGTTELPKFCDFERIERRYLSSLLVSGGKILPNRSIPNEAGFFHSPSRNV